MHERDARADRGGAAGGASRSRCASIRVEDVVLQTVATLVNLAGRRLGLAGTEAEHDLEQAQAGDRRRAGAAAAVPEEQLEPIQQALTQLQMAFAREAGQPAAGEQAPAGQPGDSQEAAQPDAKADEDAERAKARSKIWTPPGT